MDSDTTTQTTPPTTTSNNDKPDREKIVAGLASKIGQGMALKTVDASSYATVYPKLAPHFTYEEFEEIAEQANAIAYAERNRIDGSIHAKQQATLALNDTAQTVPPDVLARVAKHLRLLLKPEELENYNDALRRSRGGAIDYNDVAFVAAIHRLSVTENVDKEQGAGASPFSRITKASKEFGPNPLDNRQVRHALGILEALGFTSEIAPAIYNRHDKTQNRSALWRLYNSNYWTPIFSHKS